MITAIREAVEELDRGEADLTSHEEVADWLKTWGTVLDDDRKVFTDAIGEERDEP